MAAGRTEGERRSLDLMDLLKYIGSPIAIGTALLFYFGWVRSNSQAQQFKVDISVFEMSTDDLVLRSIDVLFFPLIGLLLIGLLFLRVDPWLRTHAGPASRVLGFSWMLILVGVALIVVAESAGKTLLPLFVLVAVTGMAYAARLRRHARGDENPAPLAQTLLVGALLVVILFWATERFARVGGEALAWRLQHETESRAPVSVLSDRRLHIVATGVIESALPGPDSKYTYRYDGLYFLQRSGEKYFLLSDGWQHNPSTGRLVVLPDDETIRLEFGSQPSIAPTAAP